MNRQIEQFRKYAEAVNADLFRITAIKMLPGKGKKAFVLGERDGLTSAEVEQRVLEMLRLMGRGENLYYTPMSFSKHHLLVDDMNLENLKHLIDDGYQPSAILESSPGNYQAIITFPRLDTQNDRDAVNRLIVQINRQYGDPNLSGSVHPHRAPGFQNRKPERQGPDGSYFEVRLHKAARRECGKSLELAKVIAAELVKKEMLAPRRGAGGCVSMLTATRAFEIHRADIMSRLHGSGQLDYSRLDFMIATRMAVCGHSQLDVESAILACAPAFRPSEMVESHNWPNYARRTANAAFSCSWPVGYLKHWRALEARAGVI